MKKELTSSENNANNIFSFRHCEEALADKAIQKNHIKESWIASPQKNSVSRNDERTVEYNAKIRLKRLQYQSWHRGCKETDLILGWFADEKLGKMSEQQLDIYEEFLNENDTDIWDWLVKKEVPNNSDYAEILQELTKFAGKI